MSEERPGRVFTWGVVLTGIASAVGLVFFVVFAFLVASGSEQRQQAIDRLAADQEALRDQIHDLGEEPVAPPPEDTIEDLPDVNIGDTSKNGRDGRDGRGISSTAIVDGFLRITYTDGATVNVGRVVGSDGLDGIDGTDGLDGISVTSSAVVDGDLVVSFSDGSTLNAGRVVGSAGANGINGTDGLDGSDGSDGKDGRGVASTQITPEGRLTITYTDGETADLGPVVGASGKDGRGITDVELILRDDGVCELVFTFDAEPTEQRIEVSPFVCPE